MNIATNAELGALPRRPSLGSPITGRQLEMLKLAAEGLSNAEIGERTYTTERTVREQISRVSAKLGARNRTHAVHLAWQKGYFTQNELSPWEIAERAHAAVLAALIAPADAA